MSRFTGKLLLGVLIVAAAAIGSSPASAKQEVERPFNATGIGTIEVEEFDFCNFDTFPAVVCDNEINTVVQATHLGKSTVTNDGLVTINLDQPCTTVDGDPGFIFDVASNAVIVAANGDALYVVQNVSGCGDGIGQTEPTGEYMITGGTGRFEGATGSGDLSSITLEGVISNTYAGTITY